MTRRHEIRIFRVDGDSMAGTFAPGQYVVVNLCETDPSPPGLFLVFDGVGMVAKRIHVVDGIGRVTYDNPRYAAYEKPVGELNIVGRVVGRWTRM